MGVRWDQNRTLAVKVLARLSLALLSNASEQVLSCGEVFAVWIQSIITLSVSLNPFGGLSFYTFQAQRVKLTVWETS